jgi:hypothetical protein
MEKSKVMETLKTMPDTFSAEILIDRLLVIDKIEKGLEDVKNGKTYSMEESKEMAAKWLK